MKIGNEHAVKIRSAAMVAATTGASIDLYRALYACAPVVDTSIDRLLGLLVGLGLDALVTGTVVPDPAASGGPLASNTQSDASTPGVDVNHPWETGPDLAVQAGHGSKI